MTETQAELSLTVERLVKAPPERVFDAWLDPAMLMRFMCPGPGTSTPKAETDPREGGRFDLVMSDGDKQIPHGGVYRVIDRPNRLVFTWESPFSVEGSTVALDFAPFRGGTRVTLTHTRFANAEARDNHERGWTAILETLETEI